MSEYAKALLEAQRAVTAIGHDGQNQHQRYKYTSAEMLIGVCGQALNNAGLLIVRESCAVSEWVDDASGLEGWRYLRFRVRFLRIRPSEAVLDDVFIPFRK